MLELLVWFLNSIIWHKMHKMLKLFLVLNMLPQKQCLFMSFLFSGLLRDVALLSRYNYIIDLLGVQFFYPSDYFEMECF